MGNNKTILVICRNQSDLKILNKISNKNAKVIVASDSLLVQKEAGAYQFVNQVAFIEQMESFFSVANNVLSIREKINKFLTVLNPDLPNYLLEWIKWSEGGNTTQKIQDAVLLINSYLYLFLTFNVNEIMLFRRIETFWEDEILIETAKSRKIAVNSKRSWLFSTSVSFQLNVVKKKIIKEKYIFIYIPRPILIKLKQLNLLIRILRCQVNSKYKIEKGNKLITFLLGASSDKHVDNTVIVMEEFNKRKDINTVALCWNALLGFKKVKQKGLRSENLESWFPLTKLYKVFSTYLSTKRNYRKNIYKFKRNYIIEYKNVPLNDSFTLLIKNFISLDLLSHLFLYYSTRNYLNNNSPIAVKTWGENVLDFGKVFYRLICENNKGDSSKPLIFHYPVGIIMENPYTDSSDNPDVIFVSGKLDRDIIRNYTKNNVRVVISGFGRSKKINDFKNIDIYDSLKALGLSQRRKYNIFYVSSGILRGYISTQEHVKVAVSLIEFVLKNNQVSLIIKPHPTEDEYFWHHLVESYGLPDNVVLFEKQVDPYHCLNIADIIVTKFSTLALEAMEFEKPVITVALDEDRKFLNVFENGVEKINNTNFLISHLKRITENDYIFNEWKSARLIAQKDFLTKKMYKGKDSSRKIIVKTVLDMVKNVPDP